MTIANEEKLLLNLVSASLGYDTVSRTTGDMDWPAFLSLCLRHETSGLVLRGIHNSRDKLPKEVYRILKKRHFRSVYYEAKHIPQITGLFQRFDDEDIPYLPLKGYVIRNYYPSPELRTMSDIDFLINENDIGRAHRTVLTEEFTFDHNTDRHLCYFKPPMLNLEMHRALYTSTEEIFKDGYPKYYHADNVWGRLRFCDDKSRRLEMDRTDFFIHFMLHLVRHFIRSEVSVRHIIDYKLIKDRHHISLKEKVLSSYFHELGLETFVDCIDRLSENWFGHEKTDSLLDEVGDFILKGYAQNDEMSVSKVVSANAANKRSGILFQKYLCAAGFFCPSAERIRKIYPKLGRSAFFLPLGYICWYLKRMANGRRYITILLSVLKADKKKIRKMTDFYKRLELFRPPKKENNNEIIGKNRMDEMPEMRNNDRNA